MKEYIKPNILVINVESESIITSTSTQFNKSIYQENDVVVEWESLFN